MVEPRSQMLYVSVRTTYKGIVLGMCGPQSTAYVTRRFRLVPGKTKYAASEVTRVDEDDKPETPDFDFGYILLNEKDRTVEIRLKYHGKDLDENGVYPMRPLIN